jgi:hypothetical protein
MRTLIDRDPFLRAPTPEEIADREGWHIETWPAHWISHPAGVAPPSVVAYRCAFALDEAATVRVHVTADERYALYLDGARVGRGPERGDRRTWYFETYDLDLEPGAHVLVAQVWALGDAAPLAQFSVRPGFLLAGDDPRWNAVLGTGVAPWQALRLGGYDCFPNHLGFGVGCNVRIVGAEFDWGFERGAGEGWVEAEVGPEGRSAGSYDQHGTLPPAHHLRPAVLPAMREAPWRGGTVRHVAAVATEATGTLPVRERDDLPQEREGWQQLLQGQGPLTVPAHTQRRVLIDLDDYVCAYPHLVTQGGAGAQVRVTWAESLYEQEIDVKWRTFGADKGDRDAIEGKYFAGEGDVFEPDGGADRAFDPLWWRAGRYVEVWVATADEALTLEALVFLETRYPLEPTGTFTSSDARLDRVWPLMVRALQMCSHETYMDCPYYEQLMYVGDTRLEALVTYCLTRDTRLPRKAVTMYDASRFPNGLTQSRYPCRSTQVIPPFSLWWCGMVYDHALWRGDPDFVRAMMPGVRGVLDAFASYRNAQGLVEGPPGWNYVDWTRAPGWHRGTPPDGEMGASGIINWQYALILTQVAELEGWLGEREHAARLRRYAREVAAATTAAFWDAERGLFADDLAHAHVSEHAQCLALLSGLVDAEAYPRVVEGLLNAQDLTRTTIYFSHYLFETYRLLGRGDELFERLPLWFELADLGFKTTRESPEPSRSDCHAWGAHPIYHAFASVLGLRPAAFGFRDVLVQPMLGPLTSVRATLPHPLGEIAVTLRRADDALEGTVSLPGGVTGTFVHGDAAQVLQAGTRTTIAL